ncbi:MAG: hypothetical protein WCQ80_04040 [Bacilli bacterium]
MKTSKKFIEALLFFALSLMLLVASSLAWFASQSEVDVDEVVHTVGKYDVDVLLEVKTNYHPEYVEIETNEQLNTLLGNSIPNDIFEFRLTIVNQSSTDVDISLIFSDFVSEPSLEGYDMLDAFYLEDGYVVIQDETYTNIDQFTLPYVTDEAVEIDNKPLELYRFSNLVVLDRLYVLTDYSLPYQATRVVLYTIQFDSQIENIAFQEALFSINTIEIFIK